MKRRKKQSYDIRELQQDITLTTTHHSPPVSGVIILDTGLHVLEFIQHSKHVDELPQGEQVSLWHKVLPLLLVTQPLHLGAEHINGLTLHRQNFWCKRRNWQIKISPKFLCAYDYLSNTSGARETNHLSYLVWVSEKQIIIFPRV